MAPRFTLYVKAAGDGGYQGTCPFSQRVFMFMLCKMPAENFEARGIDFANKPADFLAMNPGGTVPVLVDHGAGNKVIPDSSKIVEYINELFPQPDLKLNSPAATAATEASSSIFPKFAAYMKNKDIAAMPEHRDAFKAELQKLEDYLSTDDAKSHKYLLGNEFCEIDCVLVPKLLQIKVAGAHFRGLDMNQYPAIVKYMSNASSESCLKHTLPTDEDLVSGWARHGLIVHLEGQA